MHLASSNILSDEVSADRDQFRTIYKSQIQDMSGKLKLILMLGSTLPLGLYMLFIILGVLATKSCKTSPTGFKMSVYVSASM